MIQESESRESQIQEESEGIAGEAFTEKRCGNRNRD